jgi:hypothetical protein
MLQHIVPPLHNCWSTAQQPPVQASSLSSEYGPSELLTWLEKFVSHHGLKVKARKKRPRIERGRYEQPPSKGIILVGDSGVGKTSSVYAAADSMGMNILEMNPGQRRNGKNVMECIGEAATTQSLNSNQSSNSDSVMILFDEADIVFPEDDKGFIAAVSNVLAVSKRPVVITCSAITESLASLDLPVISFQSVALLNVVAISCCAARAARRTLDYASSFLLVSRHPGDCRRALCHWQLHSCRQAADAPSFAAAVVDDHVINVDSDSEQQLGDDDDAPMVRAPSSGRKRASSEPDTEACAEEEEDVLRGVDYDGVCLTAAFRNIKEVGNCSFQDTKSQAVFPYVDFLDVLSLHSQRKIDNNAAMKSIVPMLKKFSNLQDALNMHLPITVSVWCRVTKRVVVTHHCLQHRLAQVEADEAVAAAAAPVAEQAFCPFWSCLSNLDAIVALRAIAVAFNAPNHQTSPADAHITDLYSLCATRCCDAAAAFVAAASPATPTATAPTIRSASLLSPDSCGADSFEGPLALHAACDLLSLASWHSCQSPRDMQSAATDADRTCPVELVNCMAAAAASLSDAQM